MCGGGGSPATITSPNYMQSTSEVMMQMEAMRSQREGVLGLAQNQLNNSLNQQGQALQELQQIKTQRANETSANAQRLAALVGAPAPEKSAKAPTVADNRSGQKRAGGKAELRINRGAGSYSSGAGVGLNLS
jgi:hypothetical protein